MKLLQELRLLTEAQEEFLDEFREKCSDWNLSKPLYRRHVGSSSFTETRWHAGFVKTPEEKRAFSDRVVAQGEIEVEHWMDKQDGWKEYPSRLNSIFCSTTKTISPGSKNDHLYCVIPVNGAKIASIPKDFNEHLIPVNGKTSVVFWIASYIKKAAWHVQNPDKKMDWKDKVPSLEMAVKILQDAKGNLRKEDFSDEEDFNYALACSEIVPDVLLPKNMGVELATTKDFKPGLPRREVWFSGEYFIIEAEKYSEFITALKGK